MIGLQKIKMVPDFSMFLWFFSAIVLATTKPTQQKIAKIINYHSSLEKIRFHTLSGSKLHFSEPNNFAIDFDQVFGRIFWNFWYQSIRWALFYGIRWRVKIKNYLEQFWTISYMIPGLFLDSHFGDFTFRSECICHDRVHAIFNWLHAAFSGIFLCRVDKNDIHLISIKILDTYLGMVVCRISRWALKSSLWIWWGWGCVGRG